MKANKRLDSSVPKRTQEIFKRHFWKLYMMEFFARYEWIQAKRKWLIEYKKTMQEEALYEHRMSHV